MQESKFCTQCGATYTPPAPFCPGCGTALEDAGAPADAPQQPAPQQQYAQTGATQTPAGPHPQFGNLIARCSGFPQRTLIFTAVAAGANILLTIILILMYGRQRVVVWGVTVGTQWNTGLIIFFIFIDLLLMAYLAYQFFCQMKSELFVFERGVTGTGSGTLVPSISAFSWSYDYNITAATDNFLNPEQLTLTCQGTRRRVFMPNARELMDAMAKAQQR